ncbi:Wadjet anti-phage system protein JetD domain-containing protein [uncultured Corynebacterium sp.]|uniref:Wadjet anti-phage system protein JetD domain-containing protein n=1 Tax=uncultured Corynebacterium sp. TaxID=159447 RepID=UPI0025F9A208|nr:Wadjet anti-phage system protein JetD domain-containing protein [uncultured Corynebacterium sp.]
MRWREHWIFVDRKILYWGDLDSHGFYILDLMRRSLPQDRYSWIWKPPGLIVHLELMNQ